jgi:CheY-like chemotaxis protein
MAAVLIADDSAAFRGLAARLLRREGHHVVGEARDGRSALRLADRLRPDVVLLDVHLGADDGWAVARALRRAPAPPRVVMVSSDPDAGDQELADRHGAHAFVAKAALAGADLGSLLAVAV